MSLDIADTIEPRSDQQNYEDYLLGPKVVTVTKVTRGNAEQPVVLHLAEFPDRPYKPSKSMRRVLVTCWGSDASTYIGRRLELYGDPSVMYGGQQVGGIKISALSDIDEPKKLALTVRRGKREPHVVQLLSTHQIGVDDTAILNATSVDQLRDMWPDASPEQQTMIRARVDELQEPEDNE